MQLKTPPQTESPRQLHPMQLKTPNGLGVDLQRRRAVRKRNLKAKLDDATLRRFKDFNLAVTQSTLPAFTDADIARDTKGRRIKPTRLGDGNVNVPAGSRSGFVMRPVSTPQQQPAPGLDGAAARAALGMDADAFEPQLIMAKVHTYVEVARIRGTLKEFEKTVDQRVAEKLRSNPDEPLIAEAKKALKQEIVAARAFLATSRVEFTPPPATAKFKDVAALLAMHQTEETGNVWGTKVAYLNETERQPFKLTVRDGIIYGADDKPFDTYNGKAIFVMDHDGTFYATMFPVVGKFHHSSFLAGAPVASSGEIEVCEGQLVEINRRSGHYKPTSEQLLQATGHLIALGVTADFKIGNKT